VSTGRDSQAGYTLMLQAPVVVEDQETETRFDPPPLLREHHVVSGMSVVIAGRERQFGVLAAHSTQPRTFTQDDINFLQGMASVLATALERVRAEERIRFQARLLDTVGQAVVATNLEGRITYWNHHAETLFGWSAAEATGQDSLGLALYETLREQTGENWTSEVMGRRRDGTSFPALVNSSPIRDDKGVLVGLISITADISDMKQAEAEILQSNRELAMLNQMGQALSRLAKPAEIYEMLFESIGQVMDNRNLYLALYDEANHCISFPLYTLDGERREPASRPFANGLTEYVIRTRSPLLIAGDMPQTLQTLSIDAVGRMAACYLAVPMLVGQRVVGVMAVQDYVREAALTARHLNLLATIAAQAAVALENARLYEAQARRVAEMTALVDISAALRAARSRAEMPPIILDQLLALFNADGATLATRQTTTGELVVELGRGGWVSLTGAQFPEGTGLTGRMVASGQPYLNDDVTTDSQLHQAGSLELHAVAGAPLVADQRTVGVLWMGRRTPFDQSDLRLLTAIADIAANAMQRAALHEQTQQNVQRLNALRAIDQAINASLDLRITLRVLLNQVTSQLRVDAADVLLLNPYNQTLEYAAGQGFRTAAAERAHVRLGQGYAGRAALERRTIGLPDLESEEPDLSRAALMEGEGFHAYYGVPLIAKGTVEGVLEVFHRTALTPDLDWQDFLEALAGEAAIAIDNAELFSQLQRANLQMTLAYDATIEGWSRALDLRDKETEGHTRRVTEMTVALARAVGMREDEIAHVRRGALLHDIGKMGIPDSILLKPGPLTDDEWVVMRRHPSLAYEMLSPIVYLRPALDIPYCHHEKWDGTGYPRGLKGEQIPLAARVFSVADVWDALRSDRPYRPAWPEAKVREHIRAATGSHFDPAIVEVFLRFLEPE
jgi:PAS domain S-box-containing protein